MFQHNAPGSCLRSDKCEPRILFCKKLGALKHYGVKFTHPQKFSHIKRIYQLVSS